VILSLVVTAGRTGAGGDLVHGGSGGSSGGGGDGVHVQVSPDAAASSGYVFQFTI